MGICLIVDLAAGLIIGFLALVNVWPWKYFLMSIVVAVSLVAGLRASVVRSRDFERRQVARRRSRQAQSARGQRRSLIRDLVARRAAARLGSASSAELSPAAPLAPSLAAEPAAVAEAPTGLGGDAWEPVPVPRPTYQLKARAPIAAPILVAPPVEAAQAQAEDAVQPESSGESSAAPEAVELTVGEADLDQPEFDLDAVLERRIAANE